MGRHNNFVDLTYSIPCMNKIITQFSFDLVYYIAEYIVSIYFLKIVDKNFVLSQFIVNTYFAIERKAQIRTCESR